MKKTSLFLLIILGLLQVSCSSDSDFDESENIVQVLKKYSWKSEWIYDSPIIDIDYINIERNLYTYYFTDDNYGIVRSDYKSFDTEIGTDYGTTSFDFTYTASGNSVTVKYKNYTRTFKLKDGKLVSTDGYLTLTKLEISSSDQKWVEEQKCYLLPDEERQNISFYNGKKEVNQLEIGGKKRVVIQLYLGMSKESMAYYKGISDITVSYRITGGQFLSDRGSLLNVCTGHLSCDKDEDSYESKEVTVYMSPSSSATITTTYKIYDKKLKKELPLNYSARFRVPEGYSEEIFLYSNKKYNTNYDIQDNHDKVDLGLPSGVKWATCNLGSDNPGEYGDFFQWGEPYPVYPIEDKDCKNKDLTFEQLYSQGIVDINGNLTPDYDAASQHWGNGWRMPTYLDLMELEKFCIIKEDVIDGHNCYKITGVNGNSIYFSKYIYGYWSASYTRTDRGNEAYNYVPCNGGISLGRHRRSTVHQIRPVIDF